MKEGREEEQKTGEKMKRRLHYCTDSIINSK